MRSPKIKEITWSLNEGIYHLGTGISWSKPLGLQRGGRLSEVGCNTKEQEFCSVQEIWSLLRGGHLGEVVVKRGSTVYSRKVVQYFT